MKGMQVAGSEYKTRQHGEAHVNTYVDVCTNVNTDAHAKAYTDMHGGQRRKAGGGGHGDAIGPAE